MNKLDNQTDATLIAHARENGLPIYEVCGPGGGTLNMTHSLEVAKRNLAATKHGSVWSIAPTGMRRCVARMGTT